MAASGTITGTVSVPGDRVGIVIGPKGATRRAIELEHGVDVTITAGAAPGADGDVSVRGESQAQVDAAIAMVRGYVKQEPGGAGPAPRPASTTVIPDLARGAIIGKGGASIRVLQAVTGCRIQVGDPDPATSTTVITIEGPDADIVARATARVQMVVAAERLRIEVKNRSLNEGAAVSPHVHRVVQVPPSANVGAGEAASAQCAARSAQRARARAL
jgi:polyribonucleotide nucleotidyltransferase